ncbi:hypothetical protein BpHYR1_023468 [Brachionus plicatilis]|uniref:Uncharacterized protein n=1 Tax=Brachionus plicatilis TaxID=10195 RepID=A0A3M7QB24_BRAPC|nr:hypothetical protein BpHYR1_023468 [Brachionus plicatilis]
MLDVYLGYLLTFMTTHLGFGSSQPLTDLLLGLSTPSSYSGSRSRLYGVSVLPHHGVFRLSSLSWPVGSCQMNFWRRPATSHESCSRHRQSLGCQNCFIRLSYVEQTGFIKAYIARSFFIHLIGMYQAAQEESAY